MIPFTVAHMIPLSNPHMAVSTTPPPWHYCKPAGKQVAEMWQASFSSTVDLGADHLTLEGGGGG